MVFVFGRIIGFIVGSDRVKAIEGGTTEFVQNQATATTNEKADEQKDEYDFAYCSGNAATFCPIRSGH